MVSQSMSIIRKAGDHRVTESCQILFDEFNRCHETALSSDIPRGGLMDVFAKERMFEIASQLDSISHNLQNPAKGNKQ
jgi:hypothetical protein